MKKLILLFITCAALMFGCSSESTNSQSNLQLQSITKQFFDAVQGSNLMINSSNVNLQFTDVQDKAYPISINVIDGQTIILLDNSLKENEAKLKNYIYSSLLSVEGSYNPKSDPDQLARIYTNLVSQIPITTKSIK